MEIAFVIGLLGLAMVLFSLEKLPVDIVTLALLIALVMLGILTPSEAFKGFSEPIIIILAAIFVIGGAMRETGLLDLMGKALMALLTRSSKNALLKIMPFVGLFSSVMNNTTVTAMFVGPIVGLAKKVNKSPSQLLMPLAFVSILGGTCTLIGTSTNVAVSGYIEKLGMKPVGMFEVTPIGVILLAIGILYLTYFTPRLLPDTKDLSLAEDYQIRSYLTEILVLPNSPLIGQMPLESDLSILNFQILKIIRNKESFVPSVHERLGEGDILMVAGKLENLMKVSKIEGIEIRPELQFADHHLEEADTRIAEVFVKPLSFLLGRTLRAVDFRHRFGLAVLAIYRKGQTLHESIGTIPLRAGDVLLVQGSAKRLEVLQNNPDLSVLEQTVPTANNSRSIFVLITFLAAIIVSSLGWVPLSISFLIAAILMIWRKCLPIDQVYRVIDFQLLILIGGMTAFGLAMEKTGAAQFLAEKTIHLMQPFGNLGILGGFILLAVILTQPMSNAAAALVVLPVALEAASQLHLNPRTFAIGIMLGASISLITPFEPSCLIVYGPGKYKFFDFVRVGGILTLILLVVLILLIPLFWPLHV